MTWFRERCRRIQTHTYTYIKYPSANDRFLRMLWRYRIAPCKRKMFCNTHIHTHTTHTNWFPHIKCLSIRMPICRDFHTVQHCDVVCATFNVRVFCVGYNSIQCLWCADTVNAIASHLCVYLGTKQSLYPESRFSLCEIQCSVLFTLPVNHIRYACV